MLTISQSNDLALIVFFVIATADSINDTLYPHNGCNYNYYDGPKKYHSGMTERVSR